MLANIYSPHSSLKDFISYYLFVDFYNVIPEIQCTLPQGACVMHIIYSQEAVEFIFDNSKDLFKGNVFISGYLLKAARLKSLGRIKCIVIVFKPLGAYHLFHIPMKEYFGKFISLENFVGYRASLLLASIREATNKEQVVRLLDIFFNNLNTCACYKQNRCERAISYILQFSGNVRIDQLIRDFNLCARSLDRHFDNFTGISPKQYAWLTRLHTAYNLMLTRRDISIQEIVYTLGYYDQSHFINDIKKYSGTTPQFLKNPLLNSIVSRYMEQ